MGTEKRPISELVAAAQAFDDELAHFGRLAEPARKAPLNSQKNLQRVARTFLEIGEAENRLGEAAQNLMAALTAARQRQEQQAQALQTRAQEFEQRSAVAADLLKQYGSIGEQAAEINALVQGMAAKKVNGTPGADETLLPALRELRARMAKVAEGAQNLTTAAREADFDDIARQVDSLRQQIVAAEGKVASVERTLANR
jgi:hypothetical protein